MVSSFCSDGDVTYNERMSLVDVPLICGCKKKKNSSAGLLILRVQHLMKERVSEAQSAKRGRERERGAVVLSARDGESETCAEVCSEADDVRLWCAVDSGGCSVSLGDPSVSSSAQHRDTLLIQYDKS